MKTWLITGASTGIGRGIAEAVLKNGDQAAEKTLNDHKAEITRWRTLSESTDFE